MVGVRLGVTGSGWDDFWGVLAVVLRFDIAEIRGKKTMLM